ncbi:hypothetical protein BT67DRAFT_439178 [Trichocladium antarcticum]|uniref:Uncharacterized protein n=1 Tax=Trichocladium antarcticum TaxID=1450529 RepID=A0AAN6ZHE1_9PEZI|nr:hypothetical protein BT67DRAFT_439178 [Trichocladium antarcticum]
MATGCVNCGSLGTACQPPGIAGRTSSAVYIAHCEAVMLAPLAVLYRVGWWAIP